MCVQHSTNSHCCGITVRPALDMSTAESLRRCTCGAAGWAGSSAGLRLTLRTPAKRTVGRGRCCDLGMGAAPPAEVAACSAIIAACASGCAGGCAAGCAAFCRDCHRPMPPEAACCRDCAAAAAGVPEVGLIPEVVRGGSDSRSSGGLSAAAGRAAYFCCSFLPIGSKFCSSQTRTQVDAHTRPHGSPDTTVLCTTVSPAEIARAET